MSINTDEQGNNVLDLGMRIRIKDTLGDDWVEGVEVDASERIEQVLKSSAVRNNVKPVQSSDNQENSSEEFVFTHTNPNNGVNDMKPVKTINLFKHSDKVQGVISVLSGVDLRNDRANCIKYGVESLSKMYNQGMKFGNTRKEVVKTTVINAGVRYSLFGVSKILPSMLKNVLPKEADNTIINGVTTILGDVIIGTVSKIRVNSLNKKGFNKNNIMCQSVSGVKTNFSKACTIGRYTAIAGDQIYNIVTSDMLKTEEKVLNPVVEKVVKPIEPVAKKSTVKK